ncbi:MAG: hypothetical protein B7Y56_03510 [Gallionellales bacterium 35-53-114]|jgi:hypothetical protein|nr:MAG: hypothetical protein B7Y56_03510 [Gallionellales bacterium 35-53-114]OYZ65173.1 MAG: hypothetical protein B7Y04_00670 [Gallionellales bacterium 24-53-125]OZB08080.1 MAG: hypothetical protein B7X61_11120 [Gallionellales bacterium 39-52-133]HQS59986.1 hypothetical protein [Gallionellaceae bacterium]HQS76632.1 hypothetical protein [Gallionellaceae bacterium]
MANTSQAAIKRATIAAQRKVVELDADALKELQQIYQQAADDITQRIEAYAGADGNIALQELQSVLAQVRDKLTQLADRRNALLNQSLGSSVDLGVVPLTGEGVLTSGAAMQINHEALNFVRNFIAEDGLQLSDRIWRLDRHALDLVTNSIESAIIQGHGAAQAAREFLLRGQGVPGEVASKMNAANAQAIGRAAGSVLTGEGSPMDNAMRLMRTEINRAHGTSYAYGFMKHPDAAGLKFTLSPGHPKPDICDLLSTQNLYGLGAGVYPTLEATGWPAHPNTLSFLIGVFKDEVTDADRAGKETPMQALDRLTPAQQRGVLGANKHEAYKDGKLTQGMIRAPWSAVQKRIE